MPAIQDPQTAKEPRTPTAGRMKNRPGAAEPSGGALLSRAGCRGTYPPPAAGYMKEHESRRQWDAPPPAALDGISIARFFGSKRSFVQKPKVFCHLKDQFAVPPQGSLFGNVDRIRRAEQGVRAFPIVQLHNLHPFLAAGQTFSCTNSRPHSVHLTAVDLRHGAQGGVCYRVGPAAVAARRAAIVRGYGSRVQVRFPAAQLRVTADHALDVGPPVIPRGAHVVFSFRSRPALAYGCWPMSG